MAKAAEDAVLLNTIQIGIGVLTLFGLGLTVYYTRQAARAANEAADASALSASAAIQSADTAEQSFRRLERPYLLIKIIEKNTLVYPPKEGKPYAMYTLVNYGKLPALLRSISIGLLNTPTFPLISTFAIEKKFYEVLAPGDALETQHVTVTGAEVGQAFNGTNATLLILHGLIEYEDPTGAVHTDSFCMRGLQGGRGFKIEDRPEYNWRKTEYPKQTAPEPQS